MTAHARTFEAPFPVDLRLTVGEHRVGAHDPSVRLTPDGVWRASRTPAGPATVQVTTTDSTRRRFRARAWGDGAEWALDGVPDLLGFADDTSAFDPREQPVRELHRRYPALRFGRTNALVEALVPVILEQKVTSEEAHRSFRALVRALGDPAPGPSEADVELRLRPDPPRLATLGYADLHRFGIERRRAEVVLAVCRRADSIDALAAQSSADAQAHLRRIPGIGPWTTATVAQRAFGDPDAVIVGDYHLPKLVSWTMAHEENGDDARMLELLAPFAGHRGRAVRLLGLGGSTPPRRGPRRRLRSITNI